MLVMGVDVGYGNVKAFPQSKKVKSSVYLYRERIGLGSKGIVRFGDYSYEVGKARSVELRNKEFHNSPEWLALLYYTIGGKPSPVNLVMGLPVSLSKRERREEVKRKLVGLHEFEIDGKNQKLEIRNVEVVPQGMGVLYDYFIENGALVKERTRENIIVVDIGFYTTDIFVYRHGEILEDRSTSVELGVSWIFEELREWLKVEFSAPSVSLKEIEEFWDRGYITIRGRRVDIDKEKLTEEWKTRLLKELRSREEDFDLADRVLWAGGGAYLITDKHVPEPEFANARGYYKYGMMLYGG